MPKKSGVLVFDTINSSKSKFYNKYTFNRMYRKFRKNKHQHVLSYTDYLKNIKKEIKKVPNKVSFLHLYKYNKGISNKVLKQVNYFKDITPILRRTFNDGMLNYKTVIIYPNGNFYVGHSNNIIVNNKLLNNRIYKRKKKLWLQQHNK